jgi:hypothetical protein
MGARETAFVLQKTTKTTCNTWRNKKKKNSLWFFYFCGLFSKLGFCEIHELMSFISCSNCSCWRWRCCYCSKIIVALFCRGRRWEGAKLSNKFDDQKHKQCCAASSSSSTSPQVYFFLNIIIMVINSIYF